DTRSLPVMPRDEEPQTTTQESMFNFVRLSDGGTIRQSGPRGEVGILCELADRLLGSAGPINWKTFANHCNIRQMIAQIIPGYAAIGAIDASKQEFQIEGRTFHEPRFKTPTGKARFRPVAIP